MSGCIVKDGGGVGGWGILPLLALFGLQSSRWPCLRWEQCVKLRDQLATSHATATTSTMFYCPLSSQITRSFQQKTDSWVWGISTKRELACHKQSCWSEIPPVLRCGKNHSEADGSRARAWTRAVQLQVQPHSHYGLDRLSVSFVSGSRCCWREKHAFITAGLGYVDMQLLVLEVN